MISPRVLAEIESLMKRGWSGKFSLSFKDGAIIEIEHLERERLDRQTR
jgi:hypothetical protein